ncbi:MAG: aldo/keto reductase [Thermodesulfobacteriota bacterium]
MKYRFLGSTGLLVSRISLGTMTFGTPDWGCDEAESHSIIKKYIDSGGNFLDCADIYAGGKSEEIVGRLLPQIDRDQIIIASKCYFPMGTEPNQYGLSRKHIIASCEGSLRRLKTNYIDLYYLHGPDPITPLEETMSAFNDLARQGKIRYVGCSNLFAWQIAKAFGVSARMNLERPVAAQHIYSLIHREPEREIIPAISDHGIGLFCFSPLGGGLLSGKYKGMTQPAKGTRHFFRTQVDGPRFWHPKGLKTTELLEKASSESGFSMSKLAIAWPLKRKSVTSVIIGVRTVKQLEENLAPSDWDMPDEVWHVLEAQTRPQEEYLTWFNRRNYERLFSAAEFYDDSKKLL